MLHVRQPNVALTLRVVIDVRRSGPAYSGSGPAYSGSGPAYSGSREAREGPTVGGPDPDTTSFGRAIRSEARPACTGTNSIAGMGLRFAALLVDWLIAYGLALLVAGAVDSRTDPVDRGFDHLARNRRHHRALLRLHPGQYVLGLEGAVCR